ncbi:MAG: CCA tRNA nucleotidyltransferase [Clostridia bacterium]|nr:CCA tRNA nucleotidyltransferase [Clostridia bacterium]
MQLPVQVLKILERFNLAGIEAYTVGGSVRDSLLGVEPFDFDITTKATPLEVKALFNDIKIIETGIKHGTVTLVLDGLPVEVTTYRVDKGYSDGRHPDKVSFSNNLKEDLARRDFTINAICYCPHKGYFDPFGGREDLENRLIKTVGDANKRFEEDSLRILRALRFSSFLGFEIEEDTKKAIFQSAHLMCNLSKERVFAEFKKLVTGKNAATVLCEFLPILHFAIESLGQYKSCAPCFDSLSYVSDDLSASLAAFFCSLEMDGIKTCNLAEKTLKILKSDKKTSQEVCKVITAFKTGFPCTKEEVKWLLNRVGETASYKTVRLLAAFSPEREEDIKYLTLTLDEIIKNNECYKISMLNITGDDILALGIEPQKIGLALNRLLTAVIEEVCINRKEELIAFAHNFKEDF